MAQRVVDVVLRYLKAEGVRRVFGIPGGLLHFFFEALEQDPELKLVVTRHEEGAAFMADGFARVSGQLAVCAGTSGPGSTNLLTGVACAFADGVPMLVVTGQAAVHCIGRGAAQEAGREDMDIVSMFKPVTKYSAMVTSADEMTHHLRRALRQALTGRCGPVHLNVPVDLWEQELDEDWFDPQSYRPRTETFDRDSVARAADLLLQASHPVLLVGTGVKRAQAESHVTNLAELLGARVATSPAAKGAFAEDHPLSLGILGYAGHREASDTIFSDRVDVLLSIGASLNEPTTLNWNPAFRPSLALLQIDIDAERIARAYPVEVPLVGDARTIVTELLFYLHRRLREGASISSRWNEQPPLVRGHGRYGQPELRQSSQVPLTPQRWRHELQQAWPEDCLVFSDVGGHMFFNLHELSMGPRQRFELNFGFASMGHGTAAPIGAAMACPGRPLLAIVGDACFMMNGMELITAMEHDVRVVWLVENNNMHGIIWHGSQLVGSRQPMKSATYRRPVDVSALSRAMGVHTQIVRQPGELAAALEAALSCRGPALIEILVDGSIAPPLGDRARSVAGFELEEK